MQCQEQVFLTQAGVTYLLFQAFQGLFNTCQSTSQILPWEALSGAPTSLPPIHQAWGLSFPRADQALPLQPHLLEAALPPAPGQVEAPKANSKGKIT